MPEILALNIAQYNSRIFDLRRVGFAIRSRTERRDGKVYSFFRIDLSTRLTVVPRKDEPEPTLFGELAPTRHRDEG